MAVCWSYKTFVLLFDKDLTWSLSWHLKHTLRILITPLLSSNSSDINKWNVVFFLVVSRSTSSELQKMSWNFIKWVGSALRLLTACEKYKPYKGFFSCKSVFPFQKKTRCYVFVCFLFQNSINLLEFRNISLLFTWMASFCK
jgi:hypothetical protein